MRMSGKRVIEVYDLRIGLGLNHRSTAQAGRQGMARGHPRVYVVLNRMNMLVEIFHKSMTKTHFRRENFCGEG
jgi:hypothetical protein